LKYFMRLVAIGVAYAREKSKKKDAGRKKNFFIVPSPGCVSERLFRFAPDHVLVITTIDQSVDFAGGGVTKQNSAFDTFAEENL